MKNEVTFDIENKKLNSLIQENKFDEAEQLCSRMLTDYNKFDYELLLTRARMRQCQMKYEDAALDASLALQVLPNRIDAYYVLTEFLIALNNQSEALKFLEILYHHNPENMLIKGQYQQIKEREKKKVGAKVQQRLEQRMSKENERLQKNLAKATEIKRFIEENYDRSNKSESRTINEFYDNDKNSDPVLMSDECSGDSDQESTQASQGVQKPGNAQHTETPRVHQQVDFSRLTFDKIFGKKKEVYKFKPEKLSIVQCSLCQLIFDYSSCCSHYSQLTQTDIEDLKEMMPGIAAHKDMASKKKALQKVTKSLDVLSTFKVTALTLLQGQFSEIIALYLKRDLSILLGVKSEFICQECVPMQKDEKNEPSMSLAQHALVLVNRTLTFQQQALMLNQKEDLINVGGLEEEKADFRVEGRITQAIIDEVKTELSQTKQRNFQSLDFQSLQLLTRALTNILIMTEEQSTLFKTIKQFDFIPVLLKILNCITDENIQNVDSVGPQAILFITHVLRFFIVCHSIDQSSVLSQDEPSLKQVLRKLGQYEKALPQNARLLDAMRGEHVWFSHSGSGCSLKKFYKEPLQPMRICGACKKESVDLKVCSRCLKIYYCNRNCQKAHYSKHKYECVAQTN